MTEYIVHSGKDVSSLIIGEDGGVTPVPFVVTPRPDHLPECGAIDGSMFCICDALRACEQRVLTEAPVSVFAKAFHDGQAVGFDKGVRAARDAVDGLPHWDEDSGESSFRAFDKDAALAAIDALKEKP